MKIVAILDNTLGAGGGFDQSLNALLQMQRICQGRYAFEVFTSLPANIEILKLLGIEAVLFQPTWLDHFLAKAAGQGLWQSLQLRLKLIGPLERKLLKRGCDLVYFVTPSIAPLGLQRLNYLTTVWDLCHRDTPEFPEVRAFNAVHIRDNGYRNVLASALCVLTDSPELADRASRRYGVDRERFLPMPFGPSPLMDQADALSTEAVLEKYALTPGYFYYPAQFWAHKNHIRILEALTILRDERGLSPTAVFSGKDYGNLGWVQRKIAERNLASQVKVLGFVPSTQIRGLYQGAAAVVMPTYFGPTNLPPLEAWSAGTPLIYSAHLAAQAQDAALAVEVDDAHSLADAMVRVTDPLRRQTLIAAGKQRLDDIAREREAAEKEFQVRLDRFAARRRLWG